jgi:hypothetical protein
MLGVLCLGGYEVLIKKLAYQGLSYVKVFITLSYLVSGELVFNKNTTLICSYIIDSTLSFGFSLSIIMEFILKIFNHNASFFNLIVDVAETSGCTYILAYFLIDQVNLLSTIHDNTTFFSSKVNLVSFNVYTFLTKYVYSDYHK